MTSNRRSIALAACAATALLGCSTVTQRSPSSEQGAVELKALQQAWADARVRRDITFLERLYGQELQITAMNGTVFGRSEDIANFKSGDLKPEQILNDDMDVAIYGHTAVVTGREAVKGTYKGFRGEFTMRFTNVFVQRDGRWQLVRSQTTQTR